MEPVEFKFCGEICVADILVVDAEEYVEYGVGVEGHEYIEQGGVAGE